MITLFRNLRIMEKC